MKLFLLYCVFAIAISSVRPASLKSEQTDEEDQTGRQIYTTKFDKINIDSILSNARLMNFHYKCIMDEGSCNSEGNELKRLMPDALEHNCDRCTEKQREFAVKIIRHMKEKRPDDWVVMLDKYDPERKYEGFIEAVGATSE